MRECATPIPSSELETFRKATREILDDIEKIRPLKDQIQIGKPVPYALMVAEKKNYYKKVEQKLQELTRSMQAAWNASPCYHDAAIMQEAASCLHRNKPEHGCDIITRKSLIHHPRATSGDLQKAVAAEEIFSQEALHRWCDCNELVLFRGVAGIKPEACTKLPVRPLASWTNDKEWAKTVVARTGEQGVVVKKKIPIKRIVAWSPVSEFLSGPEFETIVVSEDDYETICPEDIEAVVAGR